MTELIFLSTNKVKLAHFKYMGRKHGIRVSGFREKSFYASYHEPEIDDREVLLKKSYESAYAQWRRTGLGRRDGGFFFFEDTSVRIEALSSEREIPGVNVKFWMKGMTFKKLDALIKQNGGERTAIVRSDIVFHVPKKIRDAIGLENPYIWIWGETKGRIAERDRTITPNLVYPWLDNKTFNKWFVPDGFEKPMSMLTIEQANTVDFREKAFLQIIKKLEQLRVLSRFEKLNQTQLFLPSMSRLPSIFLICGGSCAGKTTIASWLREKYKLMHLEASDFMYKEFWERHGITSEVRIGDFAEAALKTEPAIVAGPIFDLITDRQYPAVVITGFRSPDEFHQLQSMLSPSREIQLIYLDANEEIRLERAIQRGRDNVSAEKFHKRSLQEIRMGLEKISGLEACGHIANEGTLSQLYRQFARIHGPVLNMLKSVVTRPSQSNEGELETLILLTLLQEKTKIEGFTTTEIAKLLNQHFGQAKSKNNVSRYFNQGFHPFYEIKRDKRTTRYRLSTTGISEALRLSSLNVDRTNRKATPQKKDIANWFD